MDFVLTQKSKNYWSIIFKKDRRAYVIIPNSLRALVCPQEPCDTFNMPHAFFYMFVCLTYLFTVLHLLHDIYLLTNLNLTMICINFICKFKWVNLNRRPLSVLQVSKLLRGRAGIQTPDSLAPESMFLINFRTMEPDT